MSLLHASAGLFGAVGVISAAVGAHGVSDAHLREVCLRASNYLCVFSVALIAADASLLQREKDKLCELQHQKKSEQAQDSPGQQACRGQQALGLFRARNVVTACFGVGVALFSGGLLAYGAHRRLKLRSRDCDGVIECARVCAFP